MNGLLIRPLSLSTFRDAQTLAIALDERFMELNRLLIPLIGDGVKQQVTTNGVSGGVSLSFTAIPDNSITSVKLVDEAVIAAKIADNAVTVAKVLDGAISELKIANNAVTEAKVAANAITSVKILDESILEGKLAVGSVTTAKIAANAVTANEIAANSITSSKIVAGTILASNIAAGTITGDRIAANTITGGNIAALTITAGNIQAGTITASEIAAGTITATQIAAATITANRLVAGLITAYYIAAGTITANEIAASTITASKLNVSTLSAISADLGTVTAGTLSAGTTFAGALSAATGTFAGALSAATGTFTGTLSAATGSFIGNVDAATGTIGGFTITTSALTSAAVTIRSGTGQYISVGAGGTFGKLESQTFSMFASSVAVATLGSNDTASDGFLYLRNIAGTYYFTIKPNGVNRAEFSGGIDVNGTSDFNNNDIFGVKDISCYAVNCTTVTTNNYAINAGSGAVTGGFGTFAGISCTAAATFQSTVDLQGTVDTSTNATFNLGNFKVGTGRSPTAGTLQGYLNLVAPDATVLNVPFYN